MANKSEVSFARKIESQWSALMMPEMTGLEHESVLIVDPTREEGNNVAIFKAVNGDRYGKPIWVGRWRMNQQPVGNAPSFWVDGDVLRLSVWCQADYWTVQRSTESSPRTREYSF